MRSGLFFENNEHDRPTRSTELSPSILVPSLAATKSKMSTFGASQKVLPSGLAGLSIATRNDSALSLQDEVANFVQELYVRPFAELTHKV